MIPDAAYPGPLGGCVAPMEIGIRNILDEVFLAGDDEE